MADEINRSKYEPCVPDYRGIPVDPRTGQAIDPFRCRDPKNAKRANPRNRQGYLDHRKDDYWGIE